MLPIVLLLIVSKNLIETLLKCLNSSGNHGYCLFGILYATFSRSVYIGTMVNEI
jgi:hypothetical protein